MSAQDRWWAKVRVTNACWTWTGRPNSDGYGHLRVDGRMTKAHRSRCIAGHELAGENLRVDRRGKRVCRTCNRLNSARFRISRGIGSRNDRELIKQLAAAG